MTVSIQQMTLEARITANLQNTNDDAVPSTAALSITGTPSTRLSNGVEDWQASRAWQWKHTADNPKTIAAGADLIIDLFDMGTLDVGSGPGRDHVGQLIANEEIVGLLIKNGNDIDADGQLEIQADSTNGWTPCPTHTVALGNALRGQGFTMVGQPSRHGFDVEDGVSHRIKLSAVGGSVKLEIGLLARHDDEASSSSSSSESSSSSSSSQSSSSSASSSSSSSSSESSSSPSSSSSASSSSSSVSSASSVSSSSVTSLSSASSSSQSVSESSQSVLASSSSSLGNSSQSSVSSSSASTDGT